MTAAADSAPIVIAGAGLAGLSAAIALKLAGFTVQLFEREAELKPAGAGIQLGPNATRILAQWGIPFPDSACKPEALELRNARNGALLNKIPLGGTALARYGAPYATMLRSRLQEALFTRAREVGCSIHFGCPVTAVSEDRDGVTIVASETEVRASALIGADGLWSQIRSRIPSSPAPSYTQTVVWRSLLPAEALPQSFRQSVTVWLASGAHLVHYPVSSDSTYNAVLAIDDDWRAANLNAADTSSVLPRLLRRLEDWAQVPVHALAAGKDWRPWPLYRLSPWKGGLGRIQLIGDAWHAMPPFLASGGVMAIEDAANLAASFAKAGKAIASQRAKPSSPKKTAGRSETGAPPNTIDSYDVAEIAFVLFRKMRAARVWRVAERSADMGRIYHFPRPFDRIRDAIIAALPAHALLARNDWLYGEKG